MLKRLALLFLLLLVGCTAPAGAVDFPSTFKPIEAELRSRTQVPLILPTYLPTDALVTDPETKTLYPYIFVPVQDGKFKQLYAYLSEATPNRYEIIIQALPTSNCQGATACEVGVIIGEKITEELLSIEEVYSYLEDPNFKPPYRSPEKRRDVMVGGKKRTFIPYICTAYCSESYLTWEQDGYRYTFGIRYATRQTLLKMTQSAWIQRVEDKRKIG